MVSENLGGVDLAIISLLFAWQNHSQILNVIRNASQDLEGDNVTFLRFLFELTMI